MVKSTHNTGETVKDIWILSQHLMELNLNLNKSWGIWELERATRPSAALQVVSASLWRTFFKPERASSQLAENQNRNQEHKQEQLFSPKAKLKSFTSATRSSTSTPLKRIARKKCSTRKKPRHECTRHESTQSSTKEPKREQ